LKQIDVDELVQLNMKLDDRLQLAHVDPLPVARSDPNVLILITESKTA
jgi:hypothetical protein